MAYTVVTGDILEVAILARHAAQRVMSLFHYRLVSDGGAIDGATAINDFNALFNGAGVAGMVRAWKNAVNTQVTIEEVSYQFIHAFRRARVSKLPSFLAGEFVGTSSPPNLACALTKRSDLSGRRGIGTLHMPGLVNESWELGRFLPVGLDVYGTVLTRLSETIVVDFGKTYVPVILNREVPSDSPQITSADARPTVRTMHRRTVGVGE